ncbi:MAG: DUF4143 domain-containing protein [Oscillospiraceae bacterium]|nr:DUF4143 domain-containing protein [Oscillospiraceae bacterium]
MMTNMTESLAGRISLIDLYGLPMREILGDDFRQEFLPTKEYIDTGLACYLLGWDNAQVLQNGAMSGAIFETFVIGEIIKSWTDSNGVTPNMNFYFFRDKDGNEIDLIINCSGVLYPIEIKKHINCNMSDILAFRQLDKIPDQTRGESCVVCMADDVFPITATDRAIGVRYL